MIPILIQINKVFLSAPKIIPSAAPRGAPNKSGERSPRPIIPYLFQILLKFPFFKSLFLYLHLINLILIFSPRNEMINAADIDPNAEKMAIKRGLSCNASPNGIPAHNSRKLTEYTIIISDIK